MRNEHCIVDDLDIRYAEQGNGQVVLFLHGWGTSLSTFDSLTIELKEKNARFISIDLPGFGASEVPKEAWDVSRYAEFVRTFLNKFSIREPDIIVGHSLGGRIAIKALANDVLKPKQLVLVASAGSAESRSERNLAFLALAKTGKLFLSIPPFSFFRNSFRKKLYQAAGSTDYLNAGAMKETFLKIIRENLVSDAEKIKTPTLLVWGDKDTETPLKEANTLHNAIEGSKLEIIPNAGHFVHEERPKVVAEKIVQFTNL